nr:MAG TPA: hypothetical protein [Caudoviricetes sp.]
MIKERGLAHKVSFAVSKSDEGVDVDLGAGRLVSWICNLIFQLPARFLCAIFLQNAIKFCAKLLLHGYLHII